MLVSYDFHRRRQLTFAVLAVLDGLCVTPIPVEDISDREGRRFAIALEMFGI